MQEHKNVKWSADVGADVTDGLSEAADILKRQESEALQGVRNYFCGKRPTTVATLLLKCMPHALRMIHTLPPSAALCALHSAAQAFEVQHRSVFGERLECLVHAILQMGDDSCLH